ncbi:MAG TPA: hypothetical protein VJT83_01640, partial [Chitinophagaceae bacterium]|nr:hypothetical protein [Chitinophagaceae bacterium]
MKKTILSFLLLGSSAWLMAQTPTTQNPNTRTNPANTSPTTNTNINNNTTVTPDPNSTMNKQLNTQSPERTNNLNATKPENTNNINAQNTQVTTENSITNLPTVNEQNTNIPVTTTATYTVNVPVSIRGSFETAYPSATNVTWQQSGDWYRARYRENGQIMQISYREDGKSLAMPAAPVLRTYVPEEIVSKAIDVYGLNVYAIAKTRGQDGQDMYNVTVIENGQSKSEWMNADGTTAMTPHRISDDQMVTNEKAIRSNETVEASTTTTVTEEAETTGTMNTNTENSATLSPETVNSAKPNDRLDESQQKDSTETTTDANQEALNNAATDNNVRRETEESDDVEPSVT